MLWIRVLDEAICTIMQNPTGVSKIADSQNVRDKENKTRLTPKPPQARITHVPRPRTPARPARVTAPSRAPIPEKPIKIPSPLGPPFKIWSAKIGMSTEYGIPIRLTTPSSNSRARTGFVCSTNSNPSTMASIRDPSCS